MLHYETVPEHTLELLKLISPRLRELGFYLAGGTALALRLGHRISVDLDFFSTHQFEPGGIVSEINSLSEHQSKVFNQSEGSIALINQDTKLEFLKYPYPLLEPIENIEGIPFASLADNIAMKLSALVGRGAKKDFSDIASLLEFTDLTQMIDWYRLKYPESDPFMVVKSLTWFEDADPEPDPVFLKDQSWPEIKAIILAAIK